MSLKLQKFSTIEDMVVMDMDTDVDMVMDTRKKLGRRRRQGA